MLWDNSEIERLRPWVNSITTGKVFMIDKIMDWNGIKIPLKEISGCIWLIKLSTWKTSTVEKLDIVKEMVINYLNFYPKILDFLVSIFLSTLLKSMSRSTISITLKNRKSNRKQEKSLLKNNRLKGINQK